MNDVDCSRRSPCGHAVDLVRQRSFAVARVAGGPRVKEIHEKTTRNGTARLASWTGHAAPISPEGRTHRDLPTLVPRCAIIAVIAGPPSSQLAHSAPASARVGLLARRTWRRLAPPPSSAHAHLTAARYLLLCIRGARRECSCALVERGGVGPGAPGATQVSHPSCLPQRPATLASATRLGCLPSCS